MLPPRGVYASEVKCGSENWRAISNIGYKPTVTAEQVMGVESYLYDFQGDLYGQEIEVALHAFKRPEKKFSDLEELKTQLQRDIADRYERD